MTKYITRTEYNAMVNTIVDEVTGMTALDQWEITHPLDDLVVLDEEDEEGWDDAAWHDTCDQEEEDDYWWEEPSWDLDMGFDPYEGCYTDDC
jgi:hypothetical protein